MTDRNYIVSISEPDLTMRPPRHDLEDAREIAAKHNARFPKAPPARVWHVQRDGSVVEVVS